MLKQGIVKFVSGKTKGLTLEDNPKQWFNPVDAIKDEISQSLIGQTVTLTLGQKPNQFTEIKAMPNQKHSVNLSPTKSDGARLGMAINCATSKVNTFTSVNDAEAWANHVVKFAKALLKEMDKEGLQ